MLTTKSLQIEFWPRFSRSLTFSAAYTLSKTLTTVSDDGTYTNINNAHLDYGPANFDRTHYFPGPLYGTCRKQAASWAFGVPGVGNAGPYPRFYLRNPGIHNQDRSLFKNIPFEGEGKRYLQMRLEALNVLNHPLVLRI